MKLHNYIAIFCLLAFAIGVTFVTSCVENKSAGQKPEAAGSDVSQRLAPAFQGKSLADDTTVSLANFEGHVLIIDFWATWCPPCRKEIPGFIELHEKYRDRKFAVIGMSVDRGSEEMVREFIENSKMNYPVIMALGKIQNDYEKAMGSPIRGIPTTLVVNREGGIVSVHVGYRSKEAFEKEIQELL